MLGFDALGRFALGQVGSAFIVTTMIAAAGSYSLTGIADLFRVNFLTVVGTYALTGNAAPLDRLVPAAVGTYTLTGIADLFTVTMAEAAGSYLLTGIAAVLDRSFPADAGSYTLTGIDAAFIASMAMAPGAYTLTGNDTDLLSLTVQATRRPLYLRGTSYWRGLS